MSRPLVFLLAIAGGGLLTGLVAGGLIAGWADLDTVVRSVIIGLIYTAIMTITCVGAGRYMRRRFPLTSARAVVYHVLAQTVAIVLSFAAATAVSAWLFSPIFSIEPRTTGIVGLVAFTAALFGNAVVYTLLFFRRALEAERAALEAELSALRAQINPHFLFNALNTIAALTRLNPQAAERVTENLADLFRYSLQSSRQPLVTLKDELESARLYLDIEKARFEERLVTRIEVREDLLDTAIPSLILQPLVENAVKHGVSQVLEPCTVSVSAERLGNAVYLRVTDTGPGFKENDPEEVMRQGTGLSNVRERLLLYDRSKAGIELLPQGVLIRLPHRSLPEGNVPSHSIDSRLVGRSAMSDPIAERHA